LFVIHINISIDNAKSRYTSHAHITRGNPQVYKATATSANAPSDQAHSATANRPAPDTFAPLVAPPVALAGSPAASPVAPALPLPLPPEYAAAVAVNVKPVLLPNRNVHVVSAP
jgi:hypothetical protein